MQGAAKKREIADFAEVFHACDELSADAVLVGGGAVAVWVLRYLAVSEDLKNLGPMVTKDLDLLGGETDARALAAKLGAQLIPNPRKGGPTNILGRLLLDPGLPAIDRRMVEILWSIKGASDREVQQDAIRVQFTIGPRPSRIRIATPILLMECKAANIVELDQTGRTDIPQFEALMLVAPHFINDPTMVPGKAKFDFLERIMGLAISGIGMHIRKTHQIDLAGVIANCVRLTPTGELQEALRPFTEKRYPRWLDQLRNLDAKAGITMGYPTL